MRTDGEKWMAVVGGAALIVGATSKTTAISSAFSLIVALPIGGFMIAVSMAFSLGVMLGKAAAKERRMAVAKAVRIARAPARKAPAPRNRVAAAFAAAGLN